MILGLKWFFIVAVNYQENILFLIFFLGGANSPDLNLRIVDSQKICLKESLLTHPFFSASLWDFSLWFDRLSGDVASNTALLCSSWVGSDMWLYSYIYFNIMQSLIKVKYILE